LWGPGGIGKSRLALRLLALLEAGFPEGAWFVELADLRQPELVVPQVAAVMGVSEEPGRPLLETLAEALRPRRLLVCLDTCEHLIEACADLGQALLTACPGLVLVATSREPLRIAAETVWPVPPLAMVSAGTGQALADWVGDEAVRLFADRAARYRPGFALGPDNAAAVSAICRALDGLPLAIELAAARVRVLSAEQISAFLGNMFELLTGGDRAAPPRQRALGAAIGWSYETLTGPERMLFRRLSVFAGWSLEMAEQVCAGAGIPGSDMLGLITALADKSLVVVEPQLLGQARYRMLNTIREYAAARLADGGDCEQFQLALRDYVLRIAEESLAVGMAQVPVPWPERVACSLRYDADSPNVAQVLAWCLERGDAEVGLRICVAVSPRWTVWGTFAEGGEWLDSFLALEMPALSPRVRGAALVARAQLLLSSDPAAAGALAGAGLELCREAGDRFWTAAALNVLSEAALHAGRTDEAAARVDQALSVAQAAQDGWNEGYGLGTKAAIAARAGKLREARQLGSVSVAVMSRIDQQWGAARALLGLADLARLSGHPGEAHGRYVEALPILEEIGARPEIARCLAGLGRVSLDLGAAGQARGLLARSIQLSRATGSRTGIARGLEAFAALAVYEDRPGQAVQLAAAAAALRDSAGLPPLRGARAETYLAPARRLGEPAVARLWAQGQALSSDAAIALAVDPHQPSAAADDSPALTLLKTGQEPDGSPGPLTRREYQIAGLVASGRSNRAIAEELSISLATVARHTASILAKLAFTSRTQIPAWFTSSRPDARQLDQARTPPQPAADTSRGRGSPGW
jgi:predicted ATPase/DNA-binding CsgD family transcriptional regulator